nr:TPR domain-containing glycosyltransferase [Anaerosolibacter carboniphilus]
MDLLLSLCVIAKNEEKNLPRCIESVRDIVDEIIIVDTGSTDDTVKIAECYGAKVFCYQWNDNFSDAKNFAFLQATGDWILTMDADEEINSSDREKICSLLDNDAIDIYLFHTLSYVGSSPGVDTASNLNIRLIRNHKGYQYTGAIHEQICNCNQEMIDRGKVKIEEITVYHYGYLDVVATEKNKPNRNMKILEILLEAQPRDNFHLFNMGSEYLRLRKYEKALEYYKKAYEDFMPGLAHSPKLLFKLITTLDALQMYEEEMRILNEGLTYYPQFVDLEYLKACLFHKQKKYTLAIKGFKKCLTMESAPLQLRNINEVEGYRSYYALGEIHSELEDYEEAYHYYVETIKSKPSFYMPLHRIAENLMKSGRKIQDTKITLEKFFGKKLNAGAFAKLGEIFFSIGKYDIAFDYFLKACEQMKPNQNIYYNLGMSQFYLKHYQEAYHWFEKVEEGKCYEEAAYKMILCEILSNHTENADRLIQTASNFEYKKKNKIYEAFRNLAADLPYPVVSDNKEESQQYVNIIFMILNDLIKTAAPEIFEKSLQLLNLIDSDEVLLKLAKLYYRHGYYRLAYQEFIRSINIFNRIDKEGLEMMRNSIDLARGGKGCNRYKKVKESGEYVRNN